MSDSDRRFVPQRFKKFDEDETTNQSSNNECLLYLASPAKDLKMLDAFPTIKRLREK